MRFEKRLVDYLKTCSHQRSTRRAAITALTTWMTEAQAIDTIDRAVAKESLPLTATLGRSIVYWGLENRKTVALYSAVSSIFTKQWGPQQLGLKDGSESNAIVAELLSTRSYADWSMPDLVVFAHPRRKRTADSPREIHSFEIEQQAGFSIQSIYQAYEQARGANYAWVFAHAPTIEERVERAASEMGVGVVTFSNPNSNATYRKARTKHRKAIVAQRRDVPPKERAAFLTHTGLKDPG